MTIQPGGTCSLQTQTCCGFGFALGVFLYDEPLTTPRLACFALIWAALVIFSVDSFRRARRGLAI